MSKFTTEVRYICEVYSGYDASQGYQKIDSIISEALEKIFDFDFPIFDENYRRTLEHKIIKHFYTREIGVETVSLWKFRLDTKLNEIMPYYNQLYKSQLLEFNPLYSVDLKREHSGSSNDKTTNQGKTTNINENVTMNSGTVTNSDEENNVSWDIYSDTPQGGLKNVENLEYLTNARKNTNESNNTNRNVIDTKATSNMNDVVTKVDNGVKDSVDHYLETVVGYDGIDVSERLLKYRKTFLNIDMKIIDELEDLFFQLW